MRLRFAPASLSLLCLLLLQSAMQPLTAGARPFAASSTRSAHQHNGVLLSGTQLRLRESSSPTVTMPPTTTIAAMATISATPTPLSAMTAAPAASPTPPATATVWPAASSIITSVMTTVPLTSTAMASLTPTMPLTTTVTPSSPAADRAPAPPLRAQAATTVVSTTLTIPATANIFGAGHASPPDPGGAGGGTLPPGVSFPVGAGQVLSIGTVGGQVTCNNGGNYTGADGPCLPGGTDINAVEGIAGVVAGQSSMFLVGVFLSAAEPQDPAPSRLDFSAGALGQSFRMLAPQLDQVFFLGDGLTGTGTGQTQQFSSRLRPRGSSWASPTPSTSMAIRAGMATTAANSPPAC